MTARTDQQLREFIEANSVKIPFSGCWIFMGGLDKDGYGQVWRNGKNIRAHRISYLLNIGPLLNGAVIMHRCDVPTCVNPFHLSQASQDCNNKDKLSKGRHRVASGNLHYMRVNPLARAGTNCPTSLLTESKVIEIRRAAAAGAKQIDLALSYGVTRACISAIVIRRTWKHI